MDLHDRLVGLPPAAGDDERWAASGAMALTGPTDGTPLLAPRSLVPFLRAVSREIDLLTTRLGTPVALDTVALLAERSAVTGLARRGRRSCGGATELLRCADGWIAVALARPDDVDLLPAWLGTPDVAVGVRHRCAGVLVASAAELGLPCSSLGEADTSRPVVTARPVAAGATRGRLDGAVVVDLSALWAGPLCGHVLTAAGARIVKVESVTRPDGARRGPPAFYDLLHAGQDSVALDFRDGRDLVRLRALLAAADVVIEASRPRALAQLGIDAEAVTAASPTIWISITGHGRDGWRADRVAFGDDAAVAGGLVAVDEDGPVFCADAVADPLAGLTAAAAALDRFAAGGSWIVHVAMSAVAAWCALLPPSAAPWHGPVARPRARSTWGPAAELGRDTNRVLRELT